MIRDRFGRSLVPALTRALEHVPTRQEMGCFFGDDTEAKVALGAYALTMPLAACGLAFEDERWMYAAGVSVMVGLGITLYRLSTR